MSIHLVGGGPDTTPAGAVAPFRAELPGRPRVGVALAGSPVVGRCWLPAYARVVGGDCVLLPLRPGRPFDVRGLAGLDALVVGGGRTPRYLDGLAGAAGPVGELVRAGLPYLGFSAGAMVTPVDALAGGWRQQGRAVCPEEWSEGLEELTTRPGLGLLPFPVDVHTAQAGTLGRTVAVVPADRAVAVGIDEGTCLSLPVDAADPDAGAVSGTGAVWTARGGDGGPLVSRRTAD
ncbi:hypothetical protein [Klenkia brasiliensis]|uniref:Cyanophycinase n=1 Tax=Klenkia brasiliensis TaxID=333142 RepID=A0A1G7LF52_9ACTN|nr:hypothetical protein [Klenkia brasiliensis]SDF48118.1 cyanophycinase [Klenkia brasiliensis]